MPCPFLWPFFKKNLTELWFTCRTSCSKCIIQWVLVLYSYRLGAHPDGMISSALTRAVSMTAKSSRWRVALSQTSQQRMSWGRNVRCSEVWPSPGFPRQVKEEERTLLSLSLGFVFLFKVSEAALEIPRFCPSCCLLGGEKKFKKFVLNILNE